MSIKRDDIDARKVDFSDIASSRRLPLVHPGEILRDEFLTLRTCEGDQGTPHTRQ
jgi:antitoxin HigA-1